MVHLLGLKLGSTTLKNSKIEYTCRLLICRGMSSSSSSKKEPVEKVYPPNNSLNITAVHNRNPRNLEKLRIAAKPSGWYLDNPGRCFWNKITLDMSGKHITGKVVHFHGYVPVVASTREWCIRKYIYSTIDSAAMAAVARVLAQRCLESGIIEMYCGFTEEERKKQKVSVFLNHLEEAGLVLKEPEQIHTSSFLNFTYPMEKPWEFHEDLETNEIRQETPDGTDCGWKRAFKTPLH